MQLNKQQVQHLAQLSKLALTPEEEEKMQQELSTIFDVVNALNEVNTTGIEPTSQVTGLHSVTREDAVNYNFERSDMLATMPETTDDGHLQVHSVFTGDSPSN